MNKTFFLLIAFILFFGCGRNRVLLKVPSFKDNTPEILTGFYSVHQVVNGVPSEKRGSKFLGDFVYLYKDDFYENDIYFSGIKGSFLPDCYIKTQWSDTRPEFYWQEANSKEVKYPIEFINIKEKKLTAVFKRRDNSKETVELIFYKHQLSKGMKTMPIAHRGLCYQPPFNYDGIFPANTAPAFESALRSGYKGFELDVRITKDNRFVVSHDEDLSVSTTARGLVRNKNLSEVENVLVVKSAAIPENEATAKEAFIAAPLVSLHKVVNHFISDPRLEKIVVDIKPDTDERIYLAAKHDFGNLNKEQQRKVLFLTRNESSAKRLKEVCPYADIAIEGSIGPEPVTELEKYYPEAVGLPRKAHNTISFGANFLLAFKSIETSTEKIKEALNLSEKYDYKIVFWTFSKEWRLNYLRENEFFPDFLLLDVPYYKYALQQLRYMKGKIINQDSLNSSRETVYTNPIYKRMYNQYVKDFWFQSRTLIDVSYGIGMPNHYHSNNDFAKLGNWEIKLGRSELDQYSRTNIELNETYIFASGLNSDYLFGNSSNEYKISGDAFRFGIGFSDGLGYGGASISLIPYVSQLFSWTEVKGCGDSLSNVSATNIQDDCALIERYSGAYRFGERALYGLKIDILSAVQLNVNYETSFVYPRTLFMKWAGSYILMEAGYYGLGMALDKLVDDKPFIGPIVNIIVRGGYLYLFYLLKEKDMYWPFKTEAPLRYELFNFGVSYKF